ncbi:PREDICTED: neurofilament medium polypeptide-like [Nicotiana attenuata]|uniref:neurofilament medium polypeptide-like n=1 Tax=Nicotiana attenuata TaxID=49451 RepID=UPI0009057A19|nr:PREDICTED: neurofilament medium polypeptide-like [Nicotiana attenuata]
MPKSSQTPYKAKPSSKTEAKSNNMKPKSKKIVKPSIVPTPSSPVPAPLTIPTSTGPSLQKPTTHAYVPTSKNTSKSTKIKATLRKSVKSDKVVRDAATKVDTMVKEAVVQGEPVQVITSQVKPPPSKLDVLASAIGVAPLDTVLPTSDKPQVEEPTIEKNVASLEKGVDTTTVMPMVEGEGSKEPTQKEASNGLSFNWTEDEDDNGGEKEEGVVGSHEGYPTQDISNEGKKKKNNKEEGQSESEGEDQEKASESEGEDKESEEENENMSGEFEGSMTIGNTVIAPSEEASGLKNLGPWKKLRKTPVKETNYVVPTRKEVAPPSRTPLTRSKRKVVDEQIIKESRGAKKPRKQVSVVEPVVELNGEDESVSTLPEKSST